MHMHQTRTDRRSPLPGQCSRLDVGGRGRRRKRQLVLEGEADLLVRSGPSDRGWGSPVLIVGVLPVEDVQNHGPEPGPQGHRPGSPADGPSSRQGEKDRRGGRPLPEGGVVSAGVSMRDPRLQLRVRCLATTVSFFGFIGFLISPGYDQLQEPFNLSLGAVSRCPLALIDRLPCCLKGSDSEGAERAALWFRQVPCITYSRVCRRRGNSLPVMADSFVDTA